jgi:hypothetical protein
MAICDTVLWRYNWGSEIKGKENEMYKISKMTIQRYPIFKNRCAFNGSANFAKDCFLPCY